MAFVSAAIESSVDGTILLSTEFIREKIQIRCLKEFEHGDWSRVEARSIRNTCAIAKQRTATLR